MRDLKSFAYETEMENKTWVSTGKINNKRFAEEHQLEERNIYTTQLEHFCLRICVVIICFMNYFEKSLYKLLSLIKPPVSYIGFFPYLIDFVGIFVLDKSGTRHC